MSIPRFNAQIQRIQVPTMKNYQEEQNEAIAKSLAEFGMTLLGGGSVVYAKLKMQEKKQEQDEQYYNRYKQMMEETSSDAGIKRG